MKKLILFIALFVATVAQAQQLQEVVYLKNGSIIRGTIIEQVPKESLKIKTADGSVFAYPMEEVERITKEEYEKPQKGDGTVSPKEKKEKVASVHYPIQIGVRAGLNIPEFHSSYGSVSGIGDKSTQVGYHVGVIVDIPAYKNYFYIQPGLYLTQKGFKEVYKDSYGDYKTTYSANPTYLEIPVLFSGRYTFDIVQLQLNFGPYLACGLFGDYKYKREYLDNHYSDRKDKDSFFGEDGEDMRRFDVGLSLGLGALFLNHYFVGFQYEFGLYNMLKNGWTTNRSLKNWNFALSLGYNF